MKDLATAYLIAFYGGIFIIAFIRVILQTIDEHKNKGKKDDQENQELPF